MATERSSLLGSGSGSVNVKHSGEHGAPGQAGDISTSINTEVLFNQPVDQAGDVLYASVPVQDEHGRHSVSPRDHPHSVSDLASMMHLLKGNIGTGILAMPSAIMSAGLWVGSVGVLLMGAIAVHCMHILLRCCHLLCNRIGVEKLDYGEVVHQTFKTGPEPLRKLARPSLFVLNLFLCITQFGFCTVYILFVVENVKQVVESEQPEFKMPKWAYMLIVAGLLIPLVFIRNLRILAPFSMFANMLTAVGLVIILYYCFTDMSQWSSLPAFNSTSTLPLYFGTAIYAFEGIGVVCTLEYQTFCNRVTTPPLTGHFSTGSLQYT